jgi:hypothetical protein
VSRRKSSGAAFPFFGYHFIRTTVTMPIYEFYSPQTRKIYTFFARSLAYAGKTPRCPDNPKAKMEKLVSPFSVTGRAKEKPDLPGDADADDPRMEQALAEMEREFGGMDENNPDPRQLARMMRKMTSFTGERMPAQMEEMIARMEKGEDPEKLEAEYGESLDDFEPGAGGEGGEETALSALRRLRKQRVERDPTMYEMAEYVD